MYVSIIFNFSQILFSLYKSDSNYTWKHILKTFMCICGRKTFEKFTRIQFKITFRNLKVSFMVVHTRSWVRTPTHLKIYYILDTNLI